MSTHKAEACHAGIGDGYTDARAGHPVRQQIPGHSRKAHDGMAVIRDLADADACMRGYLRACNYEAATPPRFR